MLSLPEESIVHILAHTPPLDILGCRRVCHLLRNLIDTSAELQYLLELYCAGYAPPSNPRADLSYTDQIAYLRQHQKRWASTASPSVSTYTLLRLVGGHTSTYDFYGGVYARGSSLPTGTHTRRLDLYQLPSVNKGTLWKQWSHPDLGVDVRDFAMEPDYDLLVLLEMVVHPNSVPAKGQDQRFRIHLRSLETNLPHPGAARPTIEHASPAFTRRTRSSFYFQIVGRYLAVLFLADEGGETSSWELRHIQGGSRDGVASFTFLTDRLILIPCSGAVEEAHSTDRGRLDIYTFSEPVNHSEPCQPARRIATLKIPHLLAEGLSEIARFACRCDPAPSPGIRTRHHPVHPRIFQLAPDNRVLCLSVDALVMGPRYGGWHSQGVLYAPFTDLLAAVAHLLGDPIPEVIIPWEDWAKHTSWVNTKGLKTGNECYVYGQRVVSFGIDQDESDSDDDDEIDDMVHPPSLVVFDFDPVRVRREEFQSESEIEVLDPMIDNVLEGPIDSADFLVSMFLGQEHPANTRFAMRKTLIQERLSANYYVMIDDEHVVIVLQNRFGLESSLIVYNFN